MRYNARMPSPKSLLDLDALLDFPDAIRAVIIGQRVTRLEWNNPDIYGQIRHGMLQIHRDGDWFNWLVNDGDLLATDWIVLVPHRNHSATSG